MKIRQTKFGMTQSMYRACDSTASCILNPESLQDTRFKMHKRLGIFHRAQLRQFCMFLIFLVVLLGPVLICTSVFAQETSDELRGMFLIYVEQSAHNAGRTEPEIRQPSTAVLTPDVIINAVLRTDFNGREQDFATILDDELKDYRDWKGLGEAAYNRYRTASPPKPILLFYLAAKSAVTVKDAELAKKVMDIMPANVPDLLGPLFNELRAMVPYSLKDKDYENNRSKIITRYVPDNRLEEVERRITLVLAFTSVPEKRAGLLNNLALVKYARGKKNAEQIAKELFEEARDLGSKKAAGNLKLLYK